jgi:hypothetical protein
MSLREPEHNGVHPILVQPGRARRRLRRWQLLAVASLAALTTTVSWIAVTAVSEPQLAAASPASAVRATAGSDTDEYRSEQAKAEIALLRDALESAEVAVDHGRHHSEIMWRLLQGKITAQEAWWQGGDSTCAGWVAGNEFEEAIGRLKGTEVKVQPVPAEGLAFCKQARERR